MIRFLSRMTLHRLKPEAAHNVAMAGLAALSRLPSGGLIERRARVRDPRLAQTIFGLEFPNPVGLAAGFDKQAAAVPAFAYLGFGFCEIGTVTADGQPGNPKPRIFRLREDAAIVNRLGFNSRGSAHVAQRLLGWETSGKAHRIPLGVNIGKTKLAEDAVGGYLTSYRRLARFADYMVVNVSSPNTPGLRDLQERDALEELLGRLAATNAVQDRPVPMLVKIAPDLDDAAFHAILEIAAEHMNGLIICNTTIARPDELRSANKTETGGLSGAPLRARSLEMIRTARRALGTEIPIVGVGGIFTGDDAWNTIRAGASLVQVYTGLVYEGPGIVRRINRDLVKHLEAEGLTSIAHAVGTGVEDSSIGE